MIYLLLIPAAVPVFFFFFFIYIYWPNKYPSFTESDLSHFKPPKDHLYYAGKYLNPIKRAAKGSGYEEMFLENSKPAYKDELKDRKEIILNAVGDVMVRSEISEGDSSVLWESVGKKLFSSDITYGNMEFAVNDKKNFDKIIRFSMTEKQANVMLEDDRFGKFDVVSLSNNHINDSYHEGIVETRKYLDRKGIAHAGANAEPEDSFDFPIIEKNGIKIAFLSYSFSTNGIPLEKDKEHGTNMIRFNALKDEDYDPGLIHEHIAHARKRGADLIAAAFHWGVEFEYYPPVRIVERGHDLLDAGIDIILGHHPHILNPSEWYRTKDGRQTLCLYSMSNITAQGLPLYSQSMAEIAAIKIETGKNSDGKKEVRLVECEKTPTYFLRNGKGKRSAHRVLPLFDIADQLKSDNKPDYINGFHRRRILACERDYRKYFIQPKAFDYK